MENRVKDLIRFLFIKACKVIINQIKFDYEKRYIDLYSFYLEKACISSH
jgi:hypothetical protein